MPIASRSHQYGRQGACRFEPEDLQRLVELITDGASANWHLYFSFDLPHSQEIQAHALTEIWAVANLPDHADRLYLNATLGEGTRQVTFSSSTRYGTSIRVDGDDETWVLGKYSQLDDYAKSKRRWFWWLSRAMLVSQFMFASIGGWNFGDYLGGGSGTSELYALIAWLIAVVLITIGFVVPVNPSLVLLRARPRRFDKQDLTIVIGLASLLVAIVAVLVPLIRPTPGPTSIPTVSPPAVASPTSAPP